MKFMYERRQKCRRKIACIPNVNIVSWLDLSGNRYILCYLLFYVPAKTTLSLVPASATPQQAQLIHFELLGPLPSQTSIDRKN